MYFPFYFDMSIIVLIPAMLFALWASANVNSTYKKFSKQLTSSRMTGYDAARRILDANGLRHVNIEQIAGELTDHFDPRANVLRLSGAVYGGTSVSSVGIAAHEAGHAVQYAVGYGPMKFRAAIIPVTNIGSTLAFPIFLVGLLLSYYPLAAFGIILFSLTALFQAVTLPVEFNASRRAMEALESCRVLSGDELGGARKVLRAAALTYVAALASALAQILRLVLVMNRHRD
ncbi:MAG: zinc metallopeptidase [Clostridia bacterium]|nr:zinc metallopeptidase [Clostridia bacterium]